MAWESYYEDSVVEWRALREEVKSLPLESALHKIHNWWQQAPTVQHYLHFDEYKDWPNPWELLAENTYCEVAKSLGMCYNIILLESKEINSMHIVETDNYTYIHIHTDNKEYILNYYPNEIIIDLEDECVLHTLDSKYFKNKIL